MHDKIIYQEAKVEIISIGRTFLIEFGSYTAVKRKSSLLSRQSVLFPALTLITTCQQADVVCMFL